MNQNINIEDYINLIPYAINNMNLKKEYDDYYDIGLIALTKAYNNYDGLKDTKFSTYAYRCIINEFKAELRRLLRKDRQNQKYTISLNANYKNIEDTELLDFIPSDINIEKEILNKELSEVLYNAISKFNKYDQFIFISYYGLFGNQKLTSTTIGKKFNKKSNAIINRIWKLRKHLKKNEKIINYIEVEK